MIKIIAEDDKVFFSSFANLTEFQEADIDETVLSLSELRYILRAVQSKRLRVSTEDFDTLLATIVSKSSSGGSANIDLTAYATKEDLTTKANQSDMELFGANFAATVQALITNGASKVDKEAGKGLSTNDFTTTYKNMIDTNTTTLAQKLNTPTTTDLVSVSTPTTNSVPLYTLNNNGTYVLCTPDIWLNINGYLVPGYLPSTIGT